MQRQAYTGAKIKDAINQGNVAYIKNCLKDENFDPNAEWIPTKGEGAPCTLLYWACLVGQLEIVECLIETSRVNVNKPIPHHAQTPLMEASFRGHHLIVQRLLEHEDIDPNLCSDLQATPLGGAIQKNYIQAVKALLFHPKIDVNLRLSCLTPLCIVSRDNKVEIVKELLRHPKIEINFQTTEGTSALHLAVEKNHMDVVDLLLAAKADANLKNDKEQTPLHFAVLKRQNAMIERLLPVSDVCIKDKEGNTPLMLARKLKHQEISELFEEYLLQKFCDTAEETFRFYQSDKYYFQLLAPEIFQRILLFKFLNVSIKILSEVISPVFIPKYILNLFDYYMTQNPYKLLASAFKSHQLGQNEVNFYSALKEEDLLLMQNVKKNYECINATQIIQDKFKKISTQISNDIRYVMLIKNSSHAKSEAKILKRIKNIESKLFMYSFLESAQLANELQSLAELPFYRPTLSLDTTTTIITMLARLNLLPNTVKFKEQTHCVFSLALIENKNMAMVLIDYLNLDQSHYLTNAIVNRRTEIARLLIKSGSTLRFETSNALILALSCEQPDLIPDILNADKTLLDTLTHIENGNTLLHSAVQTDNLNLLKGLLEFDQIRELINMENAIKKTPLTLAIEEGHLEMCKLLIRAGVEPMRQHLRLANEHNEEVINYLNNFFEAHGRARQSLHAAAISVTQNIGELNKPCADQKPSISHTRG